MQSYINNGISRAGMKIDIKPLIWRVYFIVFDNFIPSPLFLNSLIQ